MMNDVVEQDLRCQLCGEEPTQEFPTWMHRDGVIRHKSLDVCHMAFVVRLEAERDELRARAESAEAELGFAVVRVKMAECDLEAAEAEIAVLREQVEAMRRRELPELPDEKDGDFLLVCSSTEGYDVMHRGSVIDRKLGDDEHVYWWPLPEADE